MRAPDRVDGWLAAGPLAVREDGSDARLGGHALSLTRAQRLILTALVRRAGRLAGRRELYREAFGRPLPDGSRAVDMHVSRIRRALGTLGRCLITVGRVGYRLDIDALTDRLPKRDAAAMAGQPPPPMIRSDGGRLAAVETEDRRRGRQT